jgi:hypothetical protein
VEKVIKSHGGSRAGAGRKPAPRDPQKKLRAVWAWTTPEEQAMINDVLTADERTLILFQCVIAKQNGDDWWNTAKASRRRPRQREAGREAEKGNEDG